MEPITLEFKLLAADSHLPFLPALRLGGSAFGTGGRGPPFLFGPAGAAALRLAQFEAQLALQQLTAIAASNQGNQLTPSPLALLNLLQTAAANTPRAMYQAHPQGASFSRPRPLAQQSAQGRGSDSMSQVMNYQVTQFPPPTQLPEELESAISVRVQGAREEDAHLLNQISRQQLLDPCLRREGQGQRSDGMSVPSRSTAFHTHPAPLISDDQPEQQRDVDWSKYQTPSKLFAQQQPPQSSHANPSSGLSRGGMPGWSIPFTEPAHSHGGDVQGLYSPENAGSILASFGLSNEDLAVLSHYPDDQLTPDTLPFILRDIQIHKRNAPFSQTFPGVPDLPPPQLRPPRSRSPDVPSFLSVTQTAGKVIDYGHASRTSEESRDSYRCIRFSKEKAEAEYKSSNSSLNHKTESPKGHHSKDSSDSKKRQDYKRHTPSPETHTRTRTPVREAASKTWSDRDRSKTSNSSETRRKSSKPSRPSSFKENSGSTKRLPTPTMVSDFSADPPMVYPHTCSLCDVQCERAKDWIEHVNTVNHTASCRDLCNRYPHCKPNLPREQPTQDARRNWRSQDRSPSRSVSRSLSWSPSPSPPPERRRRSPTPPSERNHRRSYSPLHPPHHHHHPHGHSHRSPARPSSRSSPSQPLRGSSLNSHRLEKRTSESSVWGKGLRYMRRYRSLRTRTSRFRGRFFPAAVTLLNSNSAPSSSRDGQKRSCDDSAKHTFGPSSSTAKASRQSSRTGASGKRESSLSSYGRSSNSKSPACGSRKANRPPSSASTSSSMSKAGSRTKGLMSSSFSSSPVEAKPRSKASQPQILLALKETKAGQQSEAAKSPPAKKKRKKKKKKKTVCRLVNLAGLPADTSYPEVTNMVESFGEISNIILFGNTVEDKGQPQYKWAYVCMKRVKDAKALATCLTLSIRDHAISVSAGEKVEEEQTSGRVVIERNVVSMPQTPAAPTKTNNVDQGLETVQKVVQKISNEKGVVLILGLPGSGFSRSDLSDLICPFAASSEIIMAPEQKKALVTLPDMESAQEMVKVYTASPVRINDHQLTMRYLSQPVELSTPVALYGAITEHSPLEPVSWNRLLVVSNVPTTPTGPAEVQRLVQRFGAIKQTLLLTHNKSSTIIFEMATPNIALSVNKRFLRYPCIIQNNPLAFSRKPDPKKSNDKMVAADPKRAGAAPANGNDSQTSVVTTPSGGEKDSSPHSAPNGKTISEASVCMKRVKDAQALATCLTLSIRDHAISVSAGEKAEEEQTVPVVIEGNVVSMPQTPAAPTKTNKVDQGLETGQKVVQKISNEKGVVLILGLPGSGFSRSDLSDLICPFAASSEIIMAPEQKKALVTLPDMESAQEMVKVYTASPVRINDHQLTMRYLSQPVELSTPVALYGAITEHSPLEPVSWNRLLVVSNVPTTPTGPAEVQRLVQRFGAIKQTLLLSHNKSSTIIFEMATPNIALSVNKRFLRYPCIIQNNPLAFSRRPDPKKSNNNIVVADPKRAGAAPANGNDSQTSVVTTPSGGEKDSSPHSAPNGKTISEVRKEEEVNKSSLQPAEGSHGGVTDSPVDQVKDEVTDTVANISTQSNITEADVSGTDISTRSDETEAVVSDTIPQVADKEEDDIPETSPQVAVPDMDKNVLKLPEESPKVMSQLVAALRQECRTRASFSKSTTLECRARSFSRASAEQARKEQAPPSGQKHTAEKTHKVVALIKNSLSGGTRGDMEQVAKTTTQEKDQGRKRRREKKERERRTSHREGSSGSGGSRSSMRSERSRQGSRSESKREDKPKTFRVAESIKRQKEEEEDDVGEETMAFNMEDFVTVDEVGDAVEVPHPPLNITEETVEDTTTSPAPVAEQQAPEDTAQMQVEVELDTAKVGIVLDRREEEEEEVEKSPPSIGTTKEGSVKTPEGIKEENVPVCQDEVINEPRVTVDQAGSCEVTEESEVKGHQKATLRGGEPEKGVEDLHKATFVSVDQVGQVEGGEEERRRGEEERKAPGKVASKRWRERKSQDEREEEEDDEESLGKKPRREPLFHADYSIPAFNSDSPIGMEFLVPGGFFCKVCAKFYSGTEEAKRNHCRSLKHYQNLEKSLEKWKAKEDGHSVAS